MQKPSGFKSLSPWVSLAARNPAQEAVEKYTDKIMAPGQMEPKANRQFRMDREHHPGQAFGFNKTGLKEPRKKAPSGGSGGGFGFPNNV